MNKREGNGRRAGPSKRSNASELEVESDDETINLDETALKKKIAECQKLIDDSEKNETLRQEAHNRRLESIRSETAKFDAMIKDAESNAAEITIETEILDYTRKKTSLAFLRSEKATDGSNPTYLARKFVVELIGLAGAQASQSTCWSAEISKKFDELLFQAFGLRSDDFGKKPLGKQAKKRLQDIGFKPNVIEGIFAQIAANQNPEMDQIQSTKSRETEKWAEAFKTQNRNDFVELSPDQNLDSTHSEDPLDDESMVSENVDDVPNDVSDDLPDDDNDESSKRDVDVDKKEDEVIDQS